MGSEMCIRDSITTLGFVVYSTNNALDQYGDGQHLPPGDGTAIILGSTTRGDGVLDYASRRRVALGVRLLQEGKAGHLVTSGRPPGHRPESNGEAMAAFAVTLGVPVAHISTEHKATSTFENLLYAQQLLATENREISVIVTDAFHMERSALLARMIGIENVRLAAVATPASVRTEIGLLMQMREAAAWWHNLARIALWRLNDRRWPL